ncbi:MAG: hypothetical protein A2X48_07830 [Lentisphaerae bacterium GWF2_49_21]|nr:MAG: hypothetical protein A2X48_07830 [Lentisphaerae bacterium GWF2_49_21]
MMICISGIISFLLAGCAKKIDDNTLVKNTYDKYMSTLSSGNLEELKKLVAKDKATELSSPQAPAMLEMIKAMMPKKYTVGKVTVTGNDAEIEVAGENEGQKMTGNVKLAKESGQWKIVKDSWNVTIDLNAEMDKPAVSKPVQGTGKTGIPAIHQTLSGHQGDVSGMIFLPYGEKLVSISYGDYSVRTWDITSGKETASQKMENRPTCVILKPDGKSLLVADVYKVITEIPINEKGEFGSLKPFIAEGGTFMALSKDGKKLAVADFQKPVRIFDAATGALLTTVSGSDKIRCLVFSPDNEFLVGGGQGNRYKVWSTKDWTEKSYDIKKVSADCEITAVAVSADGKYMATGHNDSSIVIYDFKQRKEIKNYYVQDASTAAVAFSADGKWLVTANRNIAYVWDSATGRKLHELKGHSEDVMSLAACMDPFSIATGGKDRKILIWRDGPPPAGAVQPAPAAEAPKIAAGPLLEISGYKNMVQNAGANDGMSSWRREGDVSIEAGKPGNPCFVMKYGGEFMQKVDLPADAGGKYALFIARASSDRVEEGDQTGLPYLWGQWVNRADQNRFDGYLNADTMKLSNVKPGEWGVIYGIFQVPAVSGKVLLIVNQADGSTPQNGSAAKVDDIWMLVLASEADARKMVETYKRLGK